jgi:hypothetical protein
VDYAFEVVGSPETVRIAWDALRPGGTAVVVGLAPVGAEVSLPAIDLDGVAGAFARMRAGEGDRTVVVFDSALAGVEPALAGLSPA